MSPFPGFGALFNVIAGCFTLLIIAAMALASLGAVILFLHR